jgi:hypothetical protein
MQVEDVILQKLLEKNKTKKVTLFKPIEPEDTRKKLVVTRPSETTILPSEVFEDTKNPADEKSVIEAIKNLEQLKKVKLVWTQRSNELFYWVELK